MNVLSQWLCDYCQVELACVWKRSALYVILQSSFVSRLQPPKCLRIDELGYLSLKAPVSMYISETYQKITIPHTFSSLVATFT